MKLALISSPLEFETIEYVGCSYHLTLAQELLTNGKYISYYLEKTFTSDFIIVDNGAAEFGESIPFEDVLSAAERINADEVCLPDKLRDKERTLELHFEHYQDVPSRNRFVIPQGKDGFEWMECLDAMMEGFDFVTVGIPKHLDDNNYYNRTYVLDSLQKRGYHTMFNVHLLGCHSAPLKEIRQVVKQFPWVRGIDTAAPFAYAQYNQSVSYSKHLSYEWHKAIENKRLTMQNCFDLKSACRGL